MWNLLYHNASVVNSYEKSFGASSVRSCYWAVESASFIRELMSTLVDDDRLPAASDTRSWLFVDVESYAISEFKQQVLIDSFLANNEVDVGGCLYDEVMSRVPVFILTVVKNVSALPGVRDDVSFVRSVFSLPSLIIVPEDVLLAEIRVFTDLLVELGRISYSEQGQMERGFLEFISNYRRGSGATGSAMNLSVLDLLCYCTNRGAQNLLRSIFCLDGGIQSNNTLLCDGVGHLSSDVMSGVCAIIVSYLSSSSIRSYESVSGPLLDEVAESHRRLVDLNGLTESMLWDDIGIVAGEDYRLRLYSNLGYSINGERAASPEIGV